MEPSFLKREKEECPWYLAYLCRCNYSLLSLFQLQPTSFEIYCNPCCQVLADQIDLPCRLVKGSYYTGTDEGAVNLIKVAPER